MNESLVSQRIPYSQIRKMFDAAQKLESEGKTVIHLEIGRPDFNTPDHIVNAAIDALKTGKHHYAPNAGIPPLRKAIARKYQNRYNLDYCENSQVLVTNGVAEGIFLAVSALLDPGDQILIPDPAWINYDVVPVMNLVEPVKYSLKRDNDYLPDLDEIRSKITPRTKMIVVVNPSNPTGMVIPKEMLEQLAELAEEHNLWVLSDEIYEDIVYAPAQFTSMATIEGMRERTIILNGFSKTYSMTGWRLGYALGPKQAVNAMLRYHQYALTSTNTFAQWGAVEALEGTQEPVKMMIAEFTRRKDFIYQAVSQTAGLSCPNPQGAFYLFVSVKDLGMDGFTAADKLLAEEGIVTVPGESFGSQGAGCIRLSYANSMDNLIEAAQKLSHFTSKF